MARHWAGIRPPPPPPRVDSDIVAAMRAYGAPAEDIAQAEARAAEAEQEAATDDCEIWAENVQSWEAFLQVCTQWAYAGMGGQRTGLNYAGVESFLRITTHPRHVRARFLDIQVLERAVLDADREMNPTEDS